MIIFSSELETLIFDTASWHGKLVVSLIPSKTQQGYRNRYTLLISVSTLKHCCTLLVIHYNDVIMSTMAPQITSLTIVYSTGYSGSDQRKHQRSASLAFVRGIHRWPVNSPHKWPVTGKMFPFDDVIMFCLPTLEVLARCFINTFLHTSKASVTKSLSWIQLHDQYKTWINGIHFCF